MATNSPASKQRKREETLIETTIVEIIQDLGSVVSRDITETGLNATECMQPENARFNNTPVYPAVDHTCIDFRF